MAFVRWGIATAPSYGSHRWLRTPIALPPNRTGSTAMLHRRNLKHSMTFQYRLEQEAINLRKQVEGMPPGIRRDEILRKASQLEMAAHVNKCLSPAPSTPTTLVPWSRKMRLRPVVQSAKSQC